MNNFCTNCGKKLETNAIKCDQCNTYVVDLKVTNKKKIFRIVSIIIIILILGIIATITCYNLYYKNLNKSIYEKYLKADFKEAQYVKYDSCHACEGSCDDSCINSPKIVGCFKYYYKSNPNIVNPDIVVFSNKGDISIDSYSSIIKKYGFNEDKDEEEDKYQTEKRSYLDIEVDNINSNNIIKIYKMVNEIIDIYKKDNRNSLNISIYGDDYGKHIDISNNNTNNKSTFEWEFDYNIRLLNPNLSDVENIYNRVDDAFNSSNEEYYYND